MTRMILNSSLDKCYEKKTETSSTTAFDLNDIILGRVNGKKYDYTFSGMKNFFYANNFVPLILLGYGVYKFVVSKSHNQENQGQNYEQIRDN